MRVEDAQHVVFVDSLIRSSLTDPPRPSTFGDPAAFVSVASEVHLFDCELIGGAGSPSQPVSARAGPGSASLQIDGGFLYASGCSLVGGEGGQGGFDPGRGLCGDGGDGGFGVHLRSGQPRLALRDTVVTGGSAGRAGGPPCQDGVMGVNLQVDSGSVQTVPGRARHLRAPRVRREGESFTLRLEGQTGDLVLLLFSLSFDTHFGLPVGGTILPAAPLSSAFLGAITTPNGVLDVPASAPTLPAGGDAYVVFSQALFFNPLESIQVSSGRALVLLDALVGR